MKCPECGAWSNVIETRKTLLFGYVRRRECANEHRFTTQEVVIPDEVRRKARSDYGLVALHKGGAEAAGETTQTKDA
jgi:transcriptional regulator NrdR family protein